MRLLLVYASQVDTLRIVVEGLRLNLLIPQKMHCHWLRWWQNEAQKREGGWEGEEKAGPRAQF